MNLKLAFARAMIAVIPLAVTGVLIGPGTAHAANPVPLPAPLANHPFAFQKNGPEIYSWGPGANSPGNCTADRSELSSDGTNAVLVTSGQSGDCTDLQSPHTYPTQDGYVYETYMYASNWSQWASFWMYGNDWPADGEIDSAEGGSGTSYTSYHYEGSGGPASYSTCNDTNGCDGGAKPLQYGPSGANITPGWHTVDISYGGHGAGQGEVCVWFDGHEYGCVYGTNVLRGGTDPGYWFTWSTGSCESANNGSVCNGNYPDPGTIKVQWIRGFT